MMVDLTPAQIRMIQFLCEVSWERVRDQNLRTLNLLEVKARAALKKCEPKYPGGPAA